MAATERARKCLNPIGIETLVDTLPPAPRLDKIDGKEIYISVCGEPDITAALEKRLKQDYPNVNWKTKRTYSNDPVPLTDEEMKTADAVF